MEKHETLKHGGYLKIWGGNLSQESKIQAEPAFCPPTILWVNFCGLVHVHGMHQLKAIGGRTSTQTHCWLCADQGDLGEVINNMEPFNWEFAAHIRK